MKNKHQVVDVIKKLNYKNDIKVEGNRIEVLSNTVFLPGKGVVDNPKKRNDLGNGSWGMVDFLVNHNNFTIVDVPEFEKKRK